MNDQRPLADRLRPRLLADFVGQAHLLGPGGALAGTLRAGQLSSLILWGPPGTGKTTLARLLADYCDMHLETLSAVLSGVKDVRAAVEAARERQHSGVATVLFVDEVHRFNKAQQDAFLPHVESGVVTFIGATTENPSFEVNSALLSRARVLVLKALTRADLEAILDRAASALEVSIEPDAREMLCELADGDARRLLNLTETAAQFSETPGQVNAACVQGAAGERTRRFDKGGDVFYEQISALHKSVRGSDPDAALYWLCRMLDGGCDPLYVARRVVRMASEDIGNADPRGLQLAVAAWDTFQRLGSPEGELAIAQAVVYLASVPKSNAVYTAFGAAMTLVRNSPGYDVPMHLRNAPTAMMKSMGYGKGYRYAHDETDHYAAGETYLPRELVGTRFYEPLDSGLESRIRQRLEALRARDRAAGETGGERR
ncbi:MAG: replication-associated recombination protein A [Pseudomonadales bacterium]|nr:replication-associated recombination protein A [Pseudomonadales bacterium]